MSLFTLCAVCLADLYTSCNRSAFYSRYSVIFPPLGKLCIPQHRLDSYMSSSEIFFIISKPCIFFWLHNSMQTKTASSRIQNFFSFYMQTILSCQSVWPFSWKWHLLKKTFFLWGAFSLSFLIICPCQQGKCNKVVVEALKREISMHTWVR